MFAADLAKATGSSSLTVQMGNQHCTCILVDQFHDLFRIDIESITSHIGEYGDCAGGQNHVDHIHDCQRGEDDSLSWLYQCPEHQVDAGARHRDA